MTKIILVPECLPNAVHGCRCKQLTVFDETGRMVPELSTGKAEQLLDLTVSAYFNTSVKKASKISDGLFSACNFSTPSFVLPGTKE